MQSPQLLGALAIALQELPRPVHVPEQHVPSALGSREAATIRREFEAQDPVFLVLGAVPQYTPRFAGLGIPQPDLATAVGARQDQCPIVVGERHRVHRCALFLTPERLELWLAGAPDDPQDADDTVVTSGSDEKPVRRHIETAQWLFGDWSYDSRSYNSHGPRFERIEIPAQDAAIANDDRSEQEPIAQIAHT